MSKLDRDVIFAQHQQIETQRLLLRMVRLADAKDMFDYTSDEQTTRFIFPRHQTIAETQAGIANYFMKEPFGKFGIEEKVSGRLIGTIDLRIKENETAEIGYALSRKFWGQGMMPEAARAVIDLGFEQLDLVRIYATYDLRNVQSMKVMAKIGMQEESRIFEAEQVNGELIDKGQYGITKKMWVKQG
ncbi:MAG: GNAT family N-acetyltransferase [Enterococcus sp.]